MIFHFPLHNLIIFLDRLDNPPPQRKLHYLAEMYIFLFPPRKEGKRRGRGREGEGEGKGKGKERGRGWGSGRGRRRV